MPSIDRIQDFHEERADFGDFLIVGGTGTIGFHLFQYLRSTKHNVYATSRSISKSLPAGNWLPLDLRAKRWCLPDRNFRTAFILAGVTSLAECEADPAGTRDVNVNATACLIKNLLDRGTHVVFLSTNLVFDGGRPRSSLFETFGPLNEYGKQKADLESMFYKNSLISILRITKLDVSLIPRILEWKEKLQAHQPIEVFQDLNCSPIRIMDLLHALKTLAQKRLSGVYQLSSDVDISYYDICKQLTEKLNLPGHLCVPVTAKHIIGYPFGLPKYTTLDDHETRKELSLPVSLSKDVINELFTSIL